MKNSDDLFLKLRSAYGAINTEVPPGYKSSEDLMALWKVSRTHALRMVRKFIEEGLLEQAKVLRNSRVVPYYGPPRKNKSTKPKR